MTEEIKENSVSAMERCFLLRVGISLLDEQFDDLGLEVALDDDLALFGRAAYAAAGLEEFGKGFFIPDFAERFDYEAELVVRISKLGKNIAPRFAHRYYDAVTVGVDITARDMQERFRTEGLPWELCKGFDGSAVLGEFVPVERFAHMQNIRFNLDIDGQTVQRGHTVDMLFGVDELIAYVSQFFMLKTGDLIFTGTPVGVGPLQIGQHVEGFLEGERVLAFNVR